MRITRTSVATIIASAALLFPQAAAHAQTQSLTWRIQSFDSQVVDVKFYSQNRHHVWPSSSTVWTIRDYGVHTYRLSCIQNEKICYGAWVRGNATSYWGVGREGRQPCNNCCYTCNGGTTPIRKLND